MAQFLLVGLWRRSVWANFGIMLIAVCAAMSSGPLWARGLRRRYPIPHTFSRFSRIGMATIAMR